LGRELPLLQEHFASHRKFSEASLAEVLSLFPVKAKKLEATTLASMAFLNRGDHFEAVALPAQAQWRLPSVSTSRTSTEMGARMSS
jgi:hypothetical protein